MKVLVVSNMYPSARSPSFGVFVERITQQMRDAGFDVTLRARTADGSKVLSYLRFYAATFLSVLFSRADLLYVHFVTHAFPPVGLALLLRRVPLVVHVHGADVVPENAGSRLRNRLLRAISRWGLSRASIVVAPSRYFASEVTARLKLPPEKILVSPSGGVDTRHFAYAAPRKGSERTLLFLGRLIEGKGVLQIIPALEKLRRRSPRARFKVVFAGDGPARARLEAQAQAAPGIDVRFLGMIDPARIPALMHNSHALIFPSYRRGESLGLVALEAMACGRPVIAARSGAMVDIISDGDNGFLFEPSDVDSLSLAIERLLAVTDEALIVLAQNARRLAEQYDGSIVGGSLAAALRQRLSRAN